MSGPRRSTLRSPIAADARYVVPVATALTDLLAPASGHSLSLDAVRDAVCSRVGRSVPYGALKRVLRSAGAVVVTDPGSAGSMVVKNVCFEEARA